MYYISLIVTVPFLELLTLYPFSPCTSSGRDQQNTPYLPRPSNAFALVGRRVKRNVLLLPGQLSQPVDVKAAFVRPGVYNLAHLPPLVCVTLPVVAAQGTNRGPSSSDDRGNERWVRAVVPESLLVVRSAV
jgi:hypothetical protein